MNRVELRKISLEFRRISSNFLNSGDDTADVNLSRFLKYINENELIKGYIDKKIADADYDFRVCFDFDACGWADFNPPEDEACHIKALYDYLVYIHTEENVCVRGQARRYLWSDKSFNAIIQKFLDMAFKPLIDFINDQLSMDMIVMDEEMKAMTGNTFIQNIDTVNGSANQQVSGTINSYNTVNDTSEINSLIDKLISVLPEMQDVDSEEIESVRDDLEVIQEQLNAEAPKKSRISKALAGIKKFAGDFSMKLAVSLATKQVTATDWSSLIQQVDDVMSKLG